MANKKFASEVVSVSVYLYLLTHLLHFLVSVDVAISGPLLGNPNVSSVQNLLLSPSTFEDYFHIAIVRALLKISSHFYLPSIIYIIVFFGKKST